MTCIELRDRVDELLDDLLPPEEADRLRVHTAECDQCAADLEAARSFKDLMETRGRPAIDQWASHSLAERARAAAQRESAAVQRQSADTAVVLAPSPVRPAELVSVTDAPASAAKPALRALPAAGSKRARRAPPTWVRALAASIVIGAAVAAGWTLRPHAEGATLLPEGEEIVLARGGRALVAKGREVVTDVGARVSVPVGSEGERIAVLAGAAVFRVEPGHPFAVDTPLGTATVLGTHFQVDVRATGTVEISVLSGRVRFENRRHQARSVTAGSRLHVDRTGALHVSVGAETHDLEMIAQLRSLEIEALNGQVARLEEEVATLRRGVVAAEPVRDVRPVVEPPQDLPWNEFGAAVRELIASGKRTSDNTRGVEAMGRLMSHAGPIQAYTGAQTLFDAVWHPAFVARIADGFLVALAPDAPEEARSRAAAQIRGVAETSAARVREDLTRTELMVERMKFVRAVIVATRENLGDVAAGEVADGAARGIGPNVRPAPGFEVRTFGDDAARDIVGIYSKYFDLTDSQRATVEALAQGYVEDTRNVQQAILSRLGAEAGNALLFPREGRRRFGRRDNASRGDAPKPEAPEPAQPAPKSDTERVNDMLASLDAKLEIAQPRMRFERAIREILRPDQAERRFPPTFGLPVFRDEE